MQALVPYIQIPVVELGPVVLDSWAILVSLGFIAGLELARARGIKLGLQVKDVVDGVVAIVGMGFLVAHVVHILAYNPQRLEEEGVMALIKVWTGFSSTGGFIGALLGAALFYKVVRKRPFWIHADTIMWGFPFGWALGRLGCFSAHDHVGARSDFWLAVQFPGGSRHDLGLYEALWTIGICVVFWVLRDRPVKHGAFTALFAVLYAPIRFLLDFLRHRDLAGADVRWAGLTPAQYVMIVMFIAGIGMIWKLRLLERPADASPQPPAPPPAPSQA